MLRQNQGVPTADSLAQLAGLLADRSRAAMCLALLDGRAWTAGELAQHAGVARSTASAHLTVLVAAGLLSEQRQGRHRYLRLADDQTAQLVEDLAAVVAVPDRPSSLRTVRASQQLSVARTCYDHLAGALGVALFDALVDRALVGVRDGLVSPRMDGPGSSTWPDRMFCTRPAGRCYAPAWTGPNAATTSAAPWAPPCAPSSCNAAG